MSKKNKFVFSFLVVSGFIIYSILQGLSRLTGRPSLAPNGSLTALNPASSSTNLNNQSNSPASNNSQPVSYKIITASSATANNSSRPTPVNPIPAKATPPATTAVASGGNGQAGRGMGMGMGGGGNMMATGRYRDGVYTGNSADAYYGNVQVKVTIQSGRMTNVQFLDYPHDQQNSLYINSFATPQLASEAITAQSANVDIVSGATETSQAFIQSLQSALSQA